MPGIGRIGDTHFLRKLGHLRDEVLFGGHRERVGILGLELFLVRGLGYRVAGFDLLGGGVLGRGEGLAGDAENRAGLFSSFLGSGLETLMALGSCLGASITVMSTFSDFGRFE